MRKVFCSEGQFEKSSGYTYQPIGDEPLLSLLEPVNGSVVKVAEILRENILERNHLNVTCAENVLLGRIV